MMISSLLRAITRAHRADRGLQAAQRGREEARDDPGGAGPLRRRFGRALRPRGSRGGARALVIRDFAEAENAHQQPDMSRRGVFWQAPAPAPVVAAKKEVEEDDTTGRAEARAVAREAASAMLSSTEDEEEEEVEKNTEEEEDDT